MMAYPLPGQNELQPAQRSGLHQGEVSMSSVSKHGSSGKSKAKKGSTRSVYLAMALGVIGVRWTPRLGQSRLVHDFGKRLNEGVRVQ